MSEGNGTGKKLLWWILGGFATVIFVGMSAWMGIMWANVQRLSVNQEARGTRIAVIETKVTAVEAQVGRVNDKLDTLLGWSKPK